MADITTVISCAKEKLSTDLGKKILAVILIGLVARYILGVFYTYPTDINYWIIVSENFLSEAGLFDLPGYYYTPVWGYVMSAVSFVTGIIGIPFGEYIPELVGDSMIMDWKITLPSLSYSLLLKTVLFSIDLLVGWVLYRIGKKSYGENRAFWIFVIWFLCPFPIVISSVRVMFENLEILFMLLALLMMLEKKPEWAGLMMGLSLMTKPYGIYLGILMIGFSYAQSGSLKYSMKYIVFTIIAGIMVMLPVILTGHLSESMIWLSSRADSAGSGYNYTLYLTPVLLLMSLVSSFLIALKRNDSMNLLIGMSAIITGSMLILAGNIQYYLVLLPFILLMQTRWTYPALLMFTILGVFSFVSYSEWSSLTYIHWGHWGSGLVESFTDFLQPIEDAIPFNKTKSFTAIAVVLTPMLPLLERIISTHRRGSDV